MDLNPIIGLAKTRLGLTFEVRRLAATKVDIVEAGLDQQAATALLVDRLDRAGPVEGWLWRLAEPMTILDWNALSPEEKRRGLPLDGELLLGDGASLHFSHEGRGRWRFEHYSEGDNGQPMASDLVTLASADKRVAGILYRRYWSVKPGEMSRPVAARFVGFSGGPRA